MLEHLVEVKRQVVACLDDFRGTTEPMALLLDNAQQRDFARFRVNVLVDNGGLEGAPVVVERNPTYYNLLGRIEYRATLGAMVTDFRQIKPGALHAASGGFLVLDILDVFSHLFAWEGLKRALRSGEVRIENLAEEIAPMPSTTLRPDPIPVAVKVVLIGSARAYHLLFALDEDFRELFKVKAHFSNELDWTPEHERNYAAFVTRWVKENDLLHFDRTAVARLIEHGGRLLRRPDQALGAAHGHLRRGLRGCLLRVQPPSARGARGGCRTRDPASGVPLESDRGARARSSSGTAPS